MSLERILFCFSCFKRGNIRPYCKHSNLVQYSPSVDLPYLSGMVHHKLSLPSQWGKYKNFLISCYIKFDLTHLTGMAYHCLPSG